MNDMGKLFVTEPLSCWPAWVWVKCNYFSARVGNLASDVDLLP